MANNTYKKYGIAGYLTDMYNNRISNDFMEETVARSWEEAERNVTYRVKKRIGLANTAKVKFKQTKEQMDNSWRSV